MRTVAILIALVVITSVAVAQNTAPTDQPRVLQLIQLKYLDVATAVRIFGGNLIPVTGYNGYNARPHARRGGYSHARAGSQVGGGYSVRRTYYQPQNNYGYSDQNGDIRLPAPIPDTGQE